MSLNIWDSSSPSDLGVNIYTGLQYPINTCDLSLCQLVRKSTQHQSRHYAVTRNIGI